ncbi:MAG: hypothetical protein Q8Q10_02730, partial [bacterium]|nr:hypothetical protein [bacterium]
PKPGAVKDKATVVGEDPEYFLRIFEGTLVAIKSAENLGELQKQVVIINVNEFKLKENPTQAEFDDLLEDYRKWSTGSKEHLVGDEALKRRVWQKLEEVIYVARERFIGLKGEGK